MGAQTRYALGIEPVQPSRSLPDVIHQSCILEHFEVLRYGGTRYGKSSSQLVDGDGAAGELLKDGHPGGIGECIESGLKVSVH